MGWFKRMFGRKETAPPPPVPIVKPEPQHLASEEEVFLATLRTNPDDGNTV